MTRRLHAIVPITECDTQPMCCHGDCQQGRMCPMRVAAAELSAERYAKEMEVADRVHARELRKVMFMRFAAVLCGAVLLAWLGS